MISFNIIIEKIQRSPYMFIIYESFLQGYAQMRSYDYTCFFKGTGSIYYRNYHLIFWSDQTEVLIIPILINLFRADIL